MRAAAILIAVVGGLSLQALSQPEPATDSTTYCPTGKVWVYTAKGRYCADGKILNPPTISGEQSAEQHTKTEEPLLSSLPNITELERGAASLRVTLAKCDADAGAYSDSPSAELISSISDSRIHELNTEAFACMKLGGAGVRHGYLLKTVVATRPIQLTVSWACSKPTRKTRSP